MLKTPKSLRLQIGLFGRTNIGKSSFLNMVSGQDVAIVSEKPGTTTDVVEKSMELLPVGPVVFLDTAGIDDVSELSDLRIGKTKKIFDRADIILLLTESNEWGRCEENILSEAKTRNVSVIIVVNKIDLKYPSESFSNKIKGLTDKFLLCSSVDKAKRDKYVNDLKKHIIECCPDDFLNPPALIGDLLPKGGLAVLIVPIDLEAPKGRIILPQVQTIRDALDNNQASLVVKESEYPGVLDKFKSLPDIVVCDSQVVSHMVTNTPDSVDCTTFSILFSRYKGDLLVAATDAAMIKNLKPKDKVLIAEACSHHPIQDDIGRVKIPYWLREYVGAELDIDSCAGRDFPQDLEKYKLIIHCGGCMITRREMLFRLQKARAQGVAITNYGVTISMLAGVLERVLSPFSNVFDVFRNQSIKQEK